MALSLQIQFTLKSYPYILTPLICWLVLTVQASGSSDKTKSTGETGHPCLDVDLVTQRAETQFHLP